MAYSGLRSEILENYNGKDGLKLGDIANLNISDRIDFVMIPAMITVRPKPSKARNQYFSFNGEKGAIYIRKRE